jgi:hypothetical protein
MNIFTNNNKIEALTQQVNDLTERIEKLEYILRRYPPPYNPYFTPQTPYTPPNNINMESYTNVSGVIPNEAFGLHGPEMWATNEKTHVSFQIAPHTNYINQGINPTGINPTGINPTGINPTGINPNAP